ncbi:MAG: phosphotransferase, partial [Chloroflexota bacterium]|nr:phosphotransferase [Chloroflexota bacterium]
RKLLHGDFWPGNTIWFRQRLTGVIDWELARLGDAARDVATCRCDLAVLFDLATADLFARLYEAATGAAVPNLPFWDVYSSTSALWYMSDWVRAYQMLGRRDLTADQARGRVAVFAEAALERLQG